jgi:hypothetical protein
MMINCEKAGPIIDRIEAGDNVSKWNRFILKLHLGYCKLCKRYAVDNSVLAKLIKMVGFKSSERCLSAEEKEKLKEKLSKS